MHYASEFSVGNVESRLLVHILTSTAVVYTIAAFPFVFPCLETGIKCYTNGTFLCGCHTYLPISYHFVNVLS